MSLAQSLFTAVSCIPNMTGIFIATYFHDILPNQAFRLIFIETVLSFHTLSSSVYMVFIKITSVTGLIKSVSK